MHQTYQNKPNITKIKVVPWNLSIRCVKFNFKKLFRAFFGCLHTARTWGTPNLDQKSISLAADYSTILNAKVYLWWQIWKIQFELILEHYWIFSDGPNVFEWRSDELEGHLVEIHQNLKAKQWWFEMRNLSAKKCVKMQEINSET